MKWKKNAFAFILIVFIMFLSYNVVKHLAAEKPVVNCTKQTSVVQNTFIDDGIKLNMYGQRLNDIICVYLNNVWEKECKIEYVSDDELCITLPQKYCQDIGTLSIQLEKKINSDKTMFSNKVFVHVIEASSVQPEIVDTAPRVLELSNTQNRILRIKGYNFNENCIVTINSKEYDVNYIDESNLEVPLQYSDWCQEKSLIIRVTQQATEEKILYNLNSNIWSVDIMGKDGNELIYDWVKYRYIAHAFGAYNEKTYTNSLEAFIENYERGFRVFEVDMTFSSDNILMLRHDWQSEKLQVDTSFAESKINNLPKPFEEIRNATEAYTVLNFMDLCEIMSEYPDIYIVTDTKDTNSIAINEIFRYIVDYAKKYDESILDRIIVQIYNEQMYYQVINIYDFKSIIYTLYQFEDNNEKILRFVQDTGIKVVAMSESRMSRNFIKQLSDLGIYTYIHTVNDMNIINELLRIGVYGFYTDYLEPANDIEQRQEKDIILLDSISSYMEEINKHSDWITIISVKDDVSFGMSNQMQELLYESGAKESMIDSFRAGYILVCSDGEAIYEKKSGDDLVEYSGEFEDVNFMVLSGGYESGNVSHIIIDDVDYSPNLRGFNIVVYDKESQIVYDVVNYDIFGGGVFTRYSMADMVNNQQIKNNLNFMLEYLNALFNENYLILFSVCDDSGTSFTSEIKEKWTQLGFEKDIEFQKSYIGVINGLECVYEESSDYNLLYNDFLDGLFIHVESAGFQAGSFSSIKINDVEYSKNMRGLNIVVFDKRRNIVIDSITFDFYDGYSRDY